MSINRILLEIFSAISEYSGADVVQDLIALGTVFISRPSWPYLDCRDGNKTRTYVERSKSTSLEIRLEHLRGEVHVEDAIPLAAHISTG